MVLQWRIYLVETNEGVANIFQEILLVVNSLSKRSLIEARGSCQVLEMAHLVTPSSRRR